MALGIGLLLKNDLVLLFGALPALAWAQPGTPTIRRRHAASGLMVILAAAAAFLWVRRSILGLGYGAINHATGRAVAQFAEWPRGLALLKQSLPITTGPGVFTFLLVVAGLSFGAISRRPAWQRWHWPLVAWAMPGPIFWFLLRGNNARHLAPYLLLPLWAAVDAFAVGPRRGSTARTIFAAAIVVAANWLVIPPSSNTTLYPSANVPQSVRLLAARTVELEAAIPASNDGRSATTSPCYIGSYTLPYIELVMVNRPPARLQMQADSLWITGTMVRAHFVEADSETAYRAASAVCRPARSWEYTSDGRHRRYLGREWSHLPMAHRWFPGSAAATAPDR